MGNNLQDKIHDLKQEEIIKTAGDLFYRQGYTKTSMEQIATALAIGKPLIYSYFPGKADLLSAVCNRTTLLVANLAKYALRTQGSPTQKLRSITHELCLKVIKGQHYLAVLFREEKHLPDYARAELEENEQAFRNVVLELLEEGKRTGEFSFTADAKVLAHAISGMTTWIHTWYRANGPLTPEDIAQHMTQIVLTMVVSTPETE